MRTEHSFGSELALAFPPCSLVSGGPEVDCCDCRLARPATNRTLSRIAIGATPCAARESALGQILLIVLTGINMQTRLRNLLLITLAAVGTTFLSACSSMQIGGGNSSPYSTAVAGNSAQTADPLHQCSAPLGTVSIVEDTSAAWYRLLTGQYQLGSTVPVLKMLVQQSHCFVVVDRGVGLDSAMTERQLRDSGELRHRSHMQRGQMVAADFTISPSITFSTASAGGLSGLLAFVPGVGGALTAVASSIDTKSASTALTLIDNRSSVQIAAASGSARDLDLGAFAGFLHTNSGGVVGGYSNTPEGKVLVTAFTDSLNNLIDSLHHYKAQQIRGGLGTGGAIRVN